MGRLRVMSVIARMNVGGPAVLVTELDQRLPAERYDHRIITGWCGPDEADYLVTQAPGVEATRIPGLGRSVKPGDDLRALMALMRHMREFRPHIVHTHTAKAGVLGRVAARATQLGSATVHTYHGHLLQGYFGPTTTRGVTMVESALARSTDRLVAVGPRVRDDLLGAGIGREGQYAVISPGVPTPPALSRADARARLGLDQVAPSSHSLVA